MEAGIFIIFFIILIFVSIVTAISGEDESSRRRKRVEAFMDEMSKKEFGVTVNIKGDLNGTMVLGDLTVKDSYNNIDKSNKVLAAAVADLGCKVKEATESNALAKETYPEFKKLVGYLAVGELKSIENTWQSFLKMYPSIKKDMMAYLIIEEYIMRVHSVSGSYVDSPDACDGSADAGGSSDGGG